MLHSANWLTSKSMKKKLVAIRLFCLSLLCLGVISCIPLTKVKYLQEKEGVTPVNSFQSSRPDYKIKPGDFLYIRILTLDQKSNEILADVSGATNQGGYVNTSDQSLYLSSYLVNDSGFITYPLLGSIKAKGLTVSEIEQNLNTAASEIIKASRGLYDKVTFSEVIVLLLAVLLSKYILPETVSSSTFMS